MGLFQRIKNWFTGGGSSGSNNRTRSVNRTTNYGGGGGLSFRGSGSTGSASYRRQLVRQRREEEEKKQQVAKAFKATESKAGQTSTKSPAPVDPKQKIREQKAEARKALLADYNKATNNRYNVKGAKTKEEALKRRQAQKTNAFDADKAIWETKTHPKTMSFARGALSGVTFGGSDLIAKYAPKSAESQRAEDFYQKNKSKGAEFAGEMVGSLAGFGATGGISKAGAKAAASKLAPRALEKTSAGAVEKLAASKMIRRAAEKEAVKTLGEGASKEAISRIARRKAEETVGRLGEDIAINATTGLGMDLSRAFIESDTGNGFLNRDWGKFGKEMAVSAGTNALLGTATSFAPALRAGRGVVDDAVEGVAKNADDVKVSLRRKRRGDVVMPEVRPQSAEEAVRPQENIVFKADDAIRELDGKGEAWLGEHGHITANEDGTYNLFVNGVGDRTLTRADAEDYIKRATDNLNEYAERTRTTRVSPLNDAANARISEIDDEIAQLRSEGLEDANQLKSDKYKGIEDYWDRQAERGGKETKLTREKDDIIRKEPPKTTEEVSEATAKATDDSFPATLDDEKIPTDNHEQTVINDTKQELAERAEKIASGEAKNEPPRVEKIEGGESGEIPKGVQQARDTHLKNTGEEVGGDKPTSFSERYDAYMDYHQSQGTGERRKRSKAAATQINAMTADTERAIREKMLNSGTLDYDVVVTEELYDQVSKEFKDDAEYWIGRIVDGAEDLDKISVKEIPEMTARCQYLMAVLDTSADEASQEAYASAFRLAKDIASKSGQSLNLRRNFVNLTEAGKIESTVDDLVKMLDSSRGFEKAHKLPRGKYDRINAIKGIIMGDPEIKSGIAKLVKAKNEDDVAEAYTELMLTLNKQNPKTGFDFIQEIRYLNMLGNPKTHIRNIFGSALFSPMRMISNTIRSGLEKSIAEKAGMDITRHGGISLEAFKEARSKDPTTEAGKKALQAFENLKTDILGSAKYEGAAKQKGRAKTAAGKFIDALSDLNSDLLSREDDFFRTRAFKENYIKSYNQYLKDGVPITEKIERRIEQEAIKESQIATFNEYNSLAEFLNNIERKAYDAKATSGERAAGIVTNAVMPFTKVPANILKQSINYSPAGIARGYMNISKAMKKGDAEMLNKAVDELASGLTGSGVMALGAFLGMSTDAFTTNAGKDDYAAKFKKAQGVQNYSVTLTDPKSGEKTSVTLDWLVPTSSTFFMGVELANQMKSGNFNALDFGGDWAQITSRLIEPVLESSMLSGLYSTLESMRSSYGDDDKQSALGLMARETAQSYLNSLIPTVAGQVARTAYKTDKQVTGDTDWEYFRNSVKSKTGLAADNKLTKKLGIEPLGADTTAYGDVKGEKKDAKDYALSALKNFISPANIQKVDLNELDEAKIKQYEDAVKNGADPTEMSYLFPKKQYKKTFKMGEEDIQMSNKDLSTYNQAKTKGGEEGMRWALEGIMFNRPTVDENGNKVMSDDALTKEDKARLMKQFKGKSLREVEQWLYDQPQFKSATEAEQKRVIKNLWSLSGQGKAQGAQRVGEQAVIVAQGGDVNEYNFKNELSEKKQQNLQAAIDSGIITYEEAVDFARNAGKTYYYENDEGGTASTYFNKKEMLQYIISKGYSYEKAAALFNAFKASNAKPYSGNSYSSGRGYGRRRRGGGYRRRSGGSKKKVVSSTMKSSPYKASTAKLKTTLPNVKTSSSKGGSLASALEDLQNTAKKVTPPKARS